MSTPVNIVLAVAGAQGVLNALDSVKGSLGGIAATALGTTSALTGVKSGLELGGELHALSARTGQLVSDLVVVRRALDNTGVGGANAAQYIGLLQRAISGLNDEGNRTDPVFKRLGLDPDQLKNLGIKEQLDALVAGFSKITNPAERATLAVQLFGRSGAQMLQLLGDSTAMATAERDAGRLAARLEQDHAQFDELGSRLTVAKLRLEEFWVVAAEKAIPTLQRMAAVMQSVNPAPLAAAAGNIAAIFAAAGAVKLIGKLDTAVLEWAKAPGVSAAGAAFAGKFLAPLTAGLSKLASVVLPALIGFEVGRAIGNAINEWRKIPVSTARAGDKTVTSAITQAGAIDSDAAKATAMEKLLALQKDITDARTEEAGKIVVSNEALQIYDQQLTVIRGMVGALNSEWAQHQIELNQAAASADRLAKSEAIAKAFLVGDERTLGALVTDPRQQKKLTENNADKLRANVADGIATRAAESDPAGALANAKAWLAIQDRNISNAKIEAAAGRNTAVNQQLLLESASAREDALKNIASLEKTIATKTAEQAQLALNGQLRAIEEKRADLEGNIGEAEAEKWPQRKALIEQEIAAQSRYLDVLQKQLDLTNDPAARASLKGQISGGLDKLSSLGNQKAQLGPDPNSFAQQMLAANTAASNSIGTLQEQMAKGWSASADTIRTSMGSALANIVMTSGSASDKLKAAGGEVEQSFIQNTAQMVADWIYQHTVLAAVHALFATLTTATTAGAEGAKTAITGAGAAARGGIAAGETAVVAANVAAQVAIHAEGEAQKTGHSIFGAAARKLLHLGETIFHAIQVGIRVAAHLAGEVAQTAITLVQSALRIGQLLIESLVYVVKAAVGALSALASIPYVGPFLAVAAMAGIFAAGAKLIGSVGHKEDGGLVTGGEQLTWINEAGPEYVFCAAAVKNLGVDTLDAMHSAAKSGGDLSAFATAAVPDGAAPGGAGGVAGGGSAAGGAMDLRSMLQDFSGRITVVNVASEREATRVQRRGKAAGDVVHIVRDNWAAITKRGPSST